MNKKLVPRYILNEVLSIIEMGVALFWSAGRMEWWPAWGALAVMSGSTCEIALGVLLASWWALILGGLSTILLILRTALEDRTLKNELTGYLDYARLVRYRLLPGIW